MVLVDSHGISRVPRYSGTCREPVICRLPGCHRLWPIVPDRSTNQLLGNSPALKPVGPYNPDESENPSVWAVSRSLAATDEITKLFSLPSGTKMVHFPEFASESLCIQLSDTALSAQWVPPFGYLRINACLRLPVAYRSQTRPSSVVDAKASTVGSS